MEQLNVASPLVLLNAMMLIEVTENPSEGNRILITATHNNITTIKLYCICLQV